MDVLTSISVPPLAPVCIVPQAGAKIYYFSFGRSHLPLCGYIHFFGCLFQRNGRKNWAVRDDVWSIFWNLFSHSRIGHTSFFGTTKEHSRLPQLRLHSEIFVFCFYRSSAPDTGVGPPVVIKGNVISERSGQVTYTGIVETMDFFHL